MSDTVISVQNLGKKYRIRHQAEGRRYTALRMLSRRNVPRRSVRCLAKTVQGAQASRLQFSRLVERKFKSEIRNRKSKITGRFLGAQRREL